MRKEDKILLVGFYALFFVSGAAGLVYQVLWLRMFTLVLGNSLHSASLVLAAFMSGLALGAWFFGRYVKGRPDVLLVYIFLELGIAVTALATGAAIPRLGFFVPAVQRLLFPTPFFLGLFRLAVSFLILLFPTVLIGGTFPVLTHFLSGSLEAAGRRIGGLYGWNTLGAVVGCAAAGFWLIRFLGIHASLQLAAAMNVCVALGAGALRLHAKAAGSPAPAETVSPEPGTGPERVFKPNTRRLVLIAAGAGGAAALAYEVAWTRFLSYILRNELYAFSIMLSTLLLGLGLGSLAYSKWLDRAGNRLRLLGQLEMVLGLAVGLCYLLCALVYRSRGIELVTFFSDPFYNLVSTRSIYALTAMFVPAVLMGAAFPLVSRLYLADSRSIGREAGLVYAVNTAGAVAGALFCGFVILPALGVQRSLLAFVALNLALGVLVLFYDSRLRNEKSLRNPLFAFTGALFFLALWFLPANQVQQFALKDKQHTQILIYREGISGTVSVLRDRINGVKTLYINAVAEVPTDLSSMQTFKLLGHLPLLLHRGEKQQVLMVTFGGGIASGAVACHPVAALDVVELEPAVVDASRVYYEENRRVLEDPRVRVHLEDGRNYLYSTDKRYDLIISDSTNPLSSDSWLLYTREFYQLCRRRLAEDGIMAQWLPVHSGTPETYCTIVKTFQEVFPHTTLWFVKDYSIMIGLPEPFSISYPELVSRLSEKTVSEDLAPYCLSEPVEVLDCFLMGEEAVRAMAARAKISTDGLPFYQLALPQRDAAGKILAMLKAHRESVFPMIRDLDGERAAFLADTLECYFRSAAFLLDRNYQGAAAVNPGSCKIKEYLRQYQDELPYTEALLKYYPSSYAVQLEAALTFTGHGDYARARELFVRLLSRGHTGPEIYSAIADLDFRMGRFRSAVENYRKALELDRNDAELMTNLAIALSAGGQPAEAMELLEKAARLDPENTGVLFNLGISYAQSGKPESAEFCFKKILGLSPDDLDALIALGSVYLARGQTAQAADQFARAAVLDPQSYPAWMGLGTSQFRLGRLAEAGKSFQKVKSLAPDDKTAAGYLEKIGALMAGK